MLIRKLSQFSKPFSTSSRPHSLAWRSRIEQERLVSLISSVLLQRRNWAPLLQTLNLSSKLTPPVFYHILRNTREDPQLCLNFFNWAKTRLGLVPDLKSQCYVINVLLKNSRPEKPMLDSLVRSHPVSVLVGSMIRACKDSDFESSIKTLSVVIQSYAYNGLCREGLEAFQLIRMHGVVPSVCACNALLDALLRKDEIKLGWCFYGATIRTGVLQDRSTWSLIGQMFSEEGKFDRIGNLLDIGIDSSMMYNLLIDNNSNIGNFGAAFDRLGEMYNRKIEAGFSTYSSILDGACQHRDDAVTERILEKMIEKELLPNNPLLGANLIVQKLCDIGSSYAAEMFLNRALQSGVEVEPATYGCMLRALSKKARAKEAIDMYQIIIEKNIAVKDNCYVAFLGALCRVDSSREISDLIRDMILRGYSPPKSDLSNYLASLCKKRRWSEAEDLLNVILDKQLLLDFSCCSSLVKHYCSVRQIGKAISLHDKIEKSDASFDVTAYNALLEAILKERSTEEADRIFDSLRKRDLASTTSFVIMIRGLCRLKDLRKAMKYHDEMLHLGLKPEKETYKLLIAGFG